MAKISGLTGVSGVPAPVERSTPNSPIAMPGQCHLAVPAAANAVPGVVVLRDIARAAGVSLSTVSLALRGHRSVSVATKSRIEAMARAMGYCANPMVHLLMSNARRARRLSSNQEVMAYICAGPSTGMIGTLAACEDTFLGARARAERLGFRLDRFDAVGRKCSEARLRQIVSARGIRGMIVADCPAGFDGVLRDDWSRVALVAIGRSLRSPQLHRAENDHCHNLREAYRILSERGFRRIGCVLSEEHDRSDDRLSLAALLTAQRHEREEGRLPPLVLQGDEHDAFDALAWRRKFHPDVLLIGKGIAGVPLLLATMASPDLPWASLTLQPEQVPGAIGGIRENHAELGAMAVELLVRQLERNEYGPPANSSTTLVPGHWMFTVEPAPAPVESIV